MKGRGFLKWLVVSDLHGPYLDPRAFKIFLKALKVSELDQIVILGDLADFQRVSSHPQRFEILNPVKPQVMDLAAEVEFIVEEILKPIRKIQPDVPIMFIPGNHERRVIRAMRGNGPAMEQLVEASMRTRRSVHLDDLLCFDQLGIDMEFGEDNYGVNVLRHKGSRVAMLHGYKTNKNRLSNYLDYFQSHVLSGHTHKDDYVRRATYRGDLIACETLCMRTVKGIEYMDEGHDPGWKQGFVTVWIDNETGQTFIKQHKIDRYRLEYHGQLLTA